MGKTFEDKRKTQTKRKAIANGTYNKRGKTMPCIKCKGERVVWTKDKYGHAKAKPCPLCNREGNEIRHELKELENES